MDKFRFTTQENQFTGECLPCTAAQFKAIVKSAVVDWKITTRQTIDQAITEGQPLDYWLHNSDYQKYCWTQSRKPRAGASFAALSTQQKLQQWTNWLKMWLPCYIFAVREFKAVPKTDKDGNPVLDAEGRQVLFRRRRQPNIMELSGLFMFDADHLPCDPRDIYERTLRTGFPWQVRLSHKTSSGHGLRLVCEAIPAIGNIADNQIELARELGLLNMKGTTDKPVTDNSCVDASRISYAPRERDIYYIDENSLFNF